MASKSGIELRMIRGEGDRTERSSAADLGAQPGRTMTLEAGDVARAGLEPAKGVVKNVAIVDNEDELCLLFSMLFERLGYRVEFVAHDGEEIVGAVAANRIHPDVILMDYRMPKMNGMKAAHEVLRIRPQTKIILATADDLVRQDAVSAGLFFLLKPFSTPTLIRTIDEALGDPK